MGRTNSHQVIFPERPAEFRERCRIRNSGITVTNYEAKPHRTPMSYRHAEAPAWPLSTRPIGQARRDSDASVAEAIGSSNTRVDQRLNGVCGFQLCAYSVIEARSARLSY
jgi:hypothetical protein